MKLRDLLNEGNVNSKYFKKEIVSQIVTEFENIPWVKSSMGRSDEISFEESVYTDGDLSLKLRFKPWSSYSSWGLYIRIKGNFKKDKTLDVLLSGWTQFGIDTKSVPGKSIKFKVNPESQIGIKSEDLLSIWKKLRPTAVKMGNEMERRRANMAAAQKSFYKR